MPLRDDDTTHLWLKRTDQYWKYQAVDSFVQDLPFYIFVALVVLGFNGHHAIINPILLWFLLLVFGGLIGASCHYLRYQCIRCPRCGFNPTRWEDEDRRLSEKYMQRKLQRMTVCPRCKSV